MMKNGLRTGIILVLSLFNTVFIVPLLYIYMFVSSKRLRVPRDDQAVIALILIKIVWIVSVFVFFASYSIFALLQTISIDVTMLLCFVIKKETDFYRGLATPIFVLFAIALTFNVWTVLFGVDPLGRAAFGRPDDIIPRLGGLFFHPFYSINISFVSLLLAW